VAACTLTALAFAGSVGARAAQVRVVDDDGKPLANVMVGCMGKESGAALTGRRVWRPFPMRVARSTASAATA
jgi:hypothetical protein